jgi:hypothetical protein
MKKIKFFGVIAALSLVAFSSCKEEIVVSSPITIASKDSATISGFVTADLSLQKAGNEGVPAGTQLMVTIPFSDLNSYASGTWQKFIVTVGDSGKYSVKIPTNTKGVRVTIAPMPFTYNQVQAYAGGSQVPALKLQFSATSYGPYTYVSSQNATLNMNYGITSGGAVGVEKVLISGKAKAETNAEIVGLENLPDGTKILFTASGWADSTTVQNGEYSMYVPKGVTVTYKISAIISTRYFVPDNADITKSIYRNEDRQYNITSTINSSSNNPKADITSISSGTQIVAPTATAVTLSGTVMIGGVSVPDGTVIYFYNSLQTWGNSVTVNGGKYSISVPVSSNLYYKYTVYTTSYSNFSSIVTGTNDQLTKNINGNTVN